MVDSVQNVPAELDASLKRLEKYQKELRQEREAKLGSVVWFWVYFHTIKWVHTVLILWTRKEADRQKGNPTCGIIPKKRGRPAKASTLKNKESGKHNS